MKEIENGLITPLLEIKDIDKVFEAINKKDTVKVSNIINACKAHFAYGVSQIADVPLVMITEDELSAKSLSEDLMALVGNDNVLIYPPRDILFYNADVHSMDITSQRLEILLSLINKENKVVIIPCESLLNPISPKETLESYTIVLEEGGIQDIGKLRARLVAMGYEHVAKVEAVGQFTIKGGIVDIFPSTGNNAYRIEFWDDEIDTIRNFNVQTQRSIERAKKITILPNQEILFRLKDIEKVTDAIRLELEDVCNKLLKEGKNSNAHFLREKIEEDLEQISNGISPSGLELYAPYTDLKFVSILDYFDANSLVILDEPKKIHAKCERVIDEYRLSMTNRLEFGHILPKQIDMIYDLEQVVSQMERFAKTLFSTFDEADRLFDASEKIILNVSENSSFYKNLDLFENELKKWKEDGYRIVILSAVKTKAMRLIDELDARGIIAGYTEKLSTTLPPGHITVCKGALKQGFTYNDLKLAIVADSELFGKEKKERKKKAKLKGSKIESFLELTPGDYVVHEMYGIGVFKGIDQICFEGINRDTIQIEYDNNTILHININQLDSIQKYVSQDGKTPKLSKIGTNDWKKAKTKAKGAVKDIAKDLIKLYSKRQNNRGFEYEEDTIWQKEFEDMFPYEETGDQLEAIEDVKRDMESDKIMDRLICGDVGYGKTEVAIRAAFKAVQNNKQVAYLVPTTILAQQHYERFAERMENYPVNVALLSRFRTPKQVKQTISDMAEGKVDIVIGTHRLLSKDVKFKDLGLVIIDEEQRFGVTHKEKLKELRTEVDVLNLTATPIPRTLHMSLIGIRDMSVLEEAPVERKAIQTYVIEYSVDFIKDAITRELSRGGQVYYVHNRVDNIDEEAVKIQDLVPSARICFAHGQMSERELEKIMLSFVNHEIDVLVSTTIIETGLDIPNANTIIINNADRMGLSQLYQLRGRVGRSSRIGYAYLMYEKDKVLKEIAEKRLQAIKQFTQLGAGFKIAMRDLEIRGAGNLLGAQQHGHMEAIGYDLYCKMLSEAVSLEKGEEVPEEFETSIEIKINAYIPYEYIPDEMQKLDIYKKIALIKNEKDFTDIQEEIEDRYGEVPGIVDNLLNIALIKSKAHALGIESVKELGKEILFEYKQDAKIDKEKLIELKKVYRDLKYKEDKKIAIRIEIPTPNRKELIGHLKQMVSELEILKVN